MLQSFICTLHKILCMLMFICVYGYVYLCSYICSFVWLNYWWNRKINDRSFSKGKDNQCRTLELFLNFWAILFTENESYSSYLLLPDHTQDISRPVMFWWLRFIFRNIISDEMRQVLIIDSRLANSKSFLV